MEVSQNNDITGVSSSRNVEIECIDISDDDVLVEEENVRMQHVKQEVFPEADEVEVITLIDHVQEAPEIPRVIFELPPERVSAHISRTGSVVECIDISDEDEVFVEKENTVVQNIKLEVPMEAEEVAIASKKDNTDDNEVADIIMEIPEVSSERETTVEIVENISRNKEVVLGGVHFSEPSEAEEVDVVIQNNSTENGFIDAIMEIPQVSSEREITMENINQDELTVEGIEISEDLVREVDEELHNAEVSPKSASEVLLQNSVAGASAGDAKDVAGISPEREMAMESADEEVGVAEKSLTVNALRISHQGKRIKFHHRNFICHPCGKSFLVEDFILHKQKVHGIDLGYKKLVRSRRTPKPVKLFQVESTKGTKRSTSQKLPRNQKAKPLPSASSVSRTKTNPKRPTAIPVAQPIDPLRCRICRKVFESTEERLVHEQESHPNAWKKISQGIQFKCAYCDRIFFSKRGRMKHKSRYHPEMVNQNIQVMKQTVNGKKGIIYACKMCPGFKFSSKSSLQDHIKIGKHVIEVQDGRDLGWGFAVVTKVDTQESTKCLQSKLVGARQNSLQCKKCLRMFDSATDMGKHELLHTSQVSKQCRICQQPFATTTLRRVHEVRKHLPNLNENELETLPQCPYCSKYFGVKYQLARHMVLKHEGMDASRPPASFRKSQSKLAALENKRQCRVCHRTFADISIRRNHELRQHMERLSEEELAVFPQCKVCCERFSTEFRLSKHVRVKHSSEGPISVSSKDESTTRPPASSETQQTVKTAECPHCPKLVSEGWLTAHIFKHHREHFNPEGCSLYECNDCPQQFLYPSQLMAHRLSHKEGNKAGYFNSKKKFAAAVQRQSVAKQRDIGFPKQNFKCQYCPKIFQNNYKLRQHESVHTGQTKYFCLFCDEVFTADWTLKNHKIRKHYDLLSPEEQSKAIRCTVCGQHYGTLALLKAHVDVHHSSTGKYKCEWCPNRYESDRRLKLHISTVHRDKSKAKTKKKISQGSVLYMKKRFVIARRLLEKNQNIPLKIVPKKKLDLVGDNSAHKCSYYAKTLTTKKRRIIHEKVHTGAIYRTCRFCKAQIHGSSSFKYHLVRYHYEFLTETEKVGVVTCSKCNVPFPTLSRLKLHEQIHTGLQLHSCEICSNQFRYRATLNKHMRTAHPEHPVMTEAETQRKSDTGAGSAKEVVPEGGDQGYDTSTPAATSQKICPDKSPTESMSIMNQAAFKSSLRAEPSIAISTFTTHSQLGVRPPQNSESQQKTQPVKTEDAPSAKLPPSPKVFSTSKSATSKNSSSLQLQRSNKVKNQLTPLQQMSINAAAKACEQHLASQESGGSPKSVPERPSQGSAGASSKSFGGGMSITPLLSKSTKRNLALNTIEDKIKTLVQHNHDRSKLKFLPKPPEKPTRSQPPPAHTATEMNLSSLLRKDVENVPAQQSQPPHYAPRKAVDPSRKIQQSKPGTQPTSSAAKPKTPTPSTSSLVRQQQPDDDLTRLVAHLPAISLVGIPPDEKSSDDDIMVMEEIARPKPAVDIRPVKQEAGPSPTPSAMRAPPVATVVPVTMALGQGVTITAIAPNLPAVPVQPFKHQQRQPGVIVKNPAAGPSRLGSASSIPSSSNTSARRIQQPIQLEQSRPTYSSTHLSVTKTARPLLPATTQVATAQTSLQAQLHLLAASSALANIGLVAAAAAAPPSYPCAKCTGSFGSEADLEHHQKTAHGRIYQCPYCPIKYTNNAAVEKHAFADHEQQYIASGRPYCTCPLCGKKARYESTLKRHKCPGMSSNTLPLQDHAQESNDEADIQCKYCCSIFDALDKYLLHLSNVHPEEYEQSTKDFFDRLKSMNNS